ncbi:type II toxin-antitoxin system VapC family toxin [Bosea sp. LjRoot237]|uniref:type II toxin-antitoxin system VapC family toxin n=1 Tax=Bosea sp. LjRoot237 TaxID=3342292 RepID=UPI003ECCD218
MGLLLDTCALLWVANGDPIAEPAKVEIDKAAKRDGVFVSPISAWEVAMLVSKARIALSMTPDAWFEAFLSLPGVNLAPMPPAILMASAFLPGPPPNDPANRIIAATARSEGFTLITRDEKLLAYGKQGHVQALAC